MYQRLIESNNTVFGHRAAARFGVMGEAVVHDTAPSPTGLSKLSSASAAGRIERIICSPVTERDNR